MISTGVQDWLLEPENPSARYLALTRLLNRSEADPEVAEARARIPEWEIVRSILDAQWPGGYWMAPGVGYSPKHKATVWQVIFLAAYGAPRTPSIDRACDYVLDHSRLPDGRFSAYRSAKGAIACLNGNLVRALLQLGYEDERVDESLGALVEMVARDGFCCRFNPPGGEQKSPPARMRDGLPCAWGAIKALGALGQVPPQQRSTAVEEAIEAGIGLLLDGDLVTGDYASRGGPSPRWRTLGFPLGYESDLLEGLLVLSRLGVGQDPRLGRALEALRAKEDGSGRWPLEATPPNMWVPAGRAGQANKWVTLRALEVLILCQPGRWPSGARG